MNSRLSEPTIAILSQTSPTIGLFDIVRIFQGDETHCVTWLKPRRGLYEAWVSPRALLAPDPVLFTFSSEHILGLGSDVLHLTQSGRIHSADLHSASMTRVPYVVQFWEGMDFFPVYTLYPDTFLQWQHTVHTAVHYARHRSPLVSHQFSPLSPMSPVSSVSPGFSGGVRGRAPRRRVEPHALSPGSQCAITLEPLTVAAAYWTPCGHAFSIAVAQALDNDARCPLCRAPCTFEDCSPPVVPTVDAGALEVEVVVEVTVPSPGSSTLPGSSGGAQVSED